MFKDLFKNWNTIPNWISIVRIILIPIFAVLFMKNEIGWSVFVLFLSGFSDFIDGKIARKFNQVSELGKMLDPVADKLTQMTIAVLLYMNFNKADDSLVKTFSWIFLVFIIKEFVMVAFGVFMVAIGLKPSAAEFYGKASTFVFYAVMLLLFAFAPEVGAFRESIWTIPEPLLLVLVGISAILCVVAFFSYFPATIKQFKEKYFNKK